MSSVQHMCAQYNVETCSWPGCFPAAGVSLPGDLSGEQLGLCGHSSLLFAGPRRTRALAWSMCVRLFGCDAVPHVEHIGWPNVVVAINTCTADTAPCNVWLYQAGLPAADSLNRYLTVQGDMHIEHQLQAYTPRQRGTAPAKVAATSSPQPSGTHRVQAGISSSSPTLPLLLLLLLPVAAAAAAAAALSLILAKSVSTRSASRCSGLVARKPCSASVASDHLRRQASTPSAVQHISQPGQRNSRHCER